MVNGVNGVNGVANSSAASVAEALGGVRPPQSGGFWTLAESASEGRDPKELLRYQFQTP